MFSDDDLDRIRLTIETLERERRNYVQRFKRGRPSRKAANERWRLKNKDRTIQWGLAATLKRYGLTIESYDALHAAQGGRCAICGMACASGFRLSVDHCHASGKVRGLLCSACNLGLGKFKDDARRLQAAAEYLLKRGP